MSPPPAPSPPCLDLDNKAQMYELMGIATTLEDCGTFYFVLFVCLRIHFGQGSVHLKIDA